MTYNKEEKELIDILTINELYTITSVKTGYVHMDKNRCCYIFTSQPTAEAFCKTHPGLSVSKSGFVTPADLLALLYRYGFIHISVDDNKVYDIYEKYGYKHFCNTLLSSSIFLLKETRKKDILPSFAECKYILPVNIKSTGREVPEILYPNAKKKDTFVYLPVFSDLEEYMLWKLNDKWTPVLIGFQQLVDCAAKDGVIINPSSNRLTLGWDKIKLIKQKDLPINPTEQQKPST